MPHIASNTVEMPAQYLYEIEEGDPPPLTDVQPAGLLQDEGEDQGDEADDVEAIADTPDAETPEGEGTPEAKAGVLTVAEAADILLTAPQRINELRGSERAAAIKASHERLTAIHSTQTQTAVEQAYQQGMENGQIQARAMAELARLDALDPYEREAEFVEDPDRRAAYHQLKAGQLAPRKQATADPAEALKADAAAEFAAVRNEPWAAELLRNEGQGKYPTTLTGYKALVADIATYRARPAKPAAPPPEAAAAARLKAGPKSTSSAGTAAPGRLTRERLDAMTPTEMERHMSTPEGEAEIDRVMALPRRK